MNGQERAKTRPDGNDPKEFRDPPFLSSFLFLLLRFATLSSSFPHTFLPLPSLPPTYHAPNLCLSFYSGPGTIANALTQRGHRAWKRLKQVLTAMTSEFFKTLPAFSRAFLSPLLLSRFSAFRISNVNLFSLTRLCRLLFLVSRKKERDVSFLYKCIHGHLKPLRTSSFPRHF